MSTQEAPVDNSPLSEKELKNFKKRLKKLKTETEKKIEEAKENIDDLNSDFEDTKSAQDHHHSDVATEEDTKLANLTAIEKGKEKLDKITVALDRISTGNYGICIETGQPIQKKRLEAMPYAIRSVAAKS